MRSSGTTVSEGGVLFADVTRPMCHCSAVVVVAAAAVAVVVVVGGVSNALDVSDWGKEEMPSPIVSSIVV